MSTIAAGTTTTNALVSTGDTTGALVLQTNGTTTAVTIDTSQNVGVGVTPSSWNTLKAIEQQNGVFWASYSGDADSYFGANAYYSSGWFRKIGGYASYYRQTTGQHQWAVAASSTAGSAISFTQAMTLDASGNLLVGTTSNSSPSRLKVTGLSTTSSNFALETTDSAGTVLFSARNDGAINTGLTTNSPYNLTTGNAASAWLGTDGFLRRSTSSLKYKTDVQNATHGLAEVMALRPVTYKSKNDGNIVFGGLIAEEIHAAGLTEFVQYAEDGSPDALAYGNMVSLAFKAIQEQQALITTLTERITALEGA